MAKTVYPKCRGRGSISGQELDPTGPSKGEEPACHNQELVQPSK